MDKFIQPVRHSSRLLVRELNLLDGRCIEGFSFSECHLLTELENLGEATAKQLGEILLLEKSTVSRLVKGLTQRGCLVSRPDQQDSRRRLLSLTDQGRAGLQDVNAFARKQVGDALEFVSEEDAQRIADGLKRYAAALKYARLSERFRIRAISRRDNPAVARIIRQVMTEYGAVGNEYSISDPEVDTMFEAYQGDQCRFYVVERGARVLGCGGVAPLKNGEAHVCELQKMYFLPDLRGTGMGSRLLRMLLRDAVELGFTHCYLETLEHMNEARYLYGKFGFRSIDSPMGCTGHSGCDAWMLKKL